jgi:glycosyltransferase involved in cell wall biosynthesis
MISIIVSTYNREKYLGSCLDSLAKQNFDKDLYEIILVNNNSKDNTEAICKDFSETHKDLKFRYIVERNQGLSYARNTGIKAASGSIILFIDDDAFALPDYLTEIYGFFVEYPDAKAIGGRIIPRFESARPAWMSKFLMPLLASLDMGDKMRSFPFNRYPIGANMGFTKSIFEKYGYFNTDLGRKGELLEASEEKEIFSKLHSDHETIYYLPNACVYHIIPDQRLTRKFIRHQAEGIGYSEWKRVRMKGRKAIMMKIFNEIFKWMASLLLFCYYLVILQPPKGLMIVMFRYHVTSGFLRRKR